MLYLKSIQQLKNHHFFVDKYQRGYRWDVRQVLDLLEDIGSFEPVGKRFYCLQPVVVRKISGKEVNSFELIDGQQRLTTLFIILTALNAERYMVDYQTRKGSAEFLNGIGENIKVEPLKMEPVVDTEELEKKLDGLWEKHIVTYPQHDNIDNYHFFKAFQIVANWFQTGQGDGDVFKEKLFKHTKLIWYLIEDQSETSEQVFMNINSGKIPLTNAELIKALFLVSNEYSSIPSAFSLKQNEIALDWDRIEYALQNDEFWYFLTEESNNQYPTRIELLFDILQQKPAKSKDPFYSYRKYAGQEKPNWDEVKSLFLLLVDWFEDRQLYHYIGYLVCRRISNITTIISIHKESDTKQEFEGMIIALIKKHFNKIEKEGDIKLYHIDNLNYERNPGAVIDVLLLHNIMTYLQSDRNYRFPFNHFKREKDWSIEHIHAQNSKLLTTSEELNAWAQENIVLLDKVDVDGQSAKGVVEKLILDLNEFLGCIERKELFQNIKEKYLDLQNRLFSFFGDLKDEDQKHGIGNLALLDRNTNSALNNSLFSIKRRKILEIDRAGGVDNNGKKVMTFIPLCTKNVFLKYYSQDVSQMHFWTEEDRKDYLTNIVELLKDFLPA